MSDLESKKERNRAEWRERETALMKRAIRVCMAALEWAKLTRSVLKDHLNHFQRLGENYGVSFRVESLFGCRALLSVAGAVF